MMYFLTSFFGFGLPWHLYFVSFYNSVYIKFAISCVFFRVFLREIYEFWMGMMPLRTTQMISFGAEPFCGVACICTNETAFHKMETGALRCICRCAPILSGLV